jgi:hypothetical protein
MTMIGTLQSFAGGFVAPMGEHQNDAKWCDVTHSHDQIGGAARGLDGQSTRLVAKWCVPGMKKPRPTLRPGWMCAARDSNPEPAD